MLSSLKNVRRYPSNHDDTCGRIDENVDNG
jgi:hypothetical protein